MQISLYLCCHLPNIKQGKGWTISTRFTSGRETCKNCNFCYQYQFFSETLSVLCGFCTMKKAIFACGFMLSLNYSHRASYALTCKDKGSQETAGLHLSYGSRSTEQIGGVVGSCWHFRWEWSHLALWATILQAATTQLFTWSSNIASGEKYTYAWFRKYILDMCLQMRLSFQKWHFSLSVTVSLDKKSRCRNLCCIS